MSYYVSAKTGVRKCYEDDTRNITSHAINCCHFFVLSKNVVCELHLKDVLSMEDGYIYQLWPRDLFELYSSNSAFVGQTQTNDTKIVKKPKYFYYPNHVLVSHFETPIKCDAIVFVIHRADCIHYRHEQEECSTLSFIEPTLHHFQRAEFDFKMGLLEEGDEIIISTKRQQELSEWKV